MFKDELLSQTEGKMTFVQSWVMKDAVHSIYQLSSKCGTLDQIEYRSHDLLHAKQSLYQLS
jgi:hypothetical protein